MEEVTLIERDRVNIGSGILATDMPKGGAQQKTATAYIGIHLMDVNDSPPHFEESGSYSAVIPENSGIGSHVIKVTATDPDLGEAGRVHYNFPEGLHRVSGLWFTSIYKSLISNIISEP